MEAIDNGQWHRFVRFNYFPFASHISDEPKVGLGTTKRDSQIQKKIFSLHQINKNNSSCCALSTNVFEFLQQNLENIASTKKGKGVLRSGVFPIYTNKII